MASIIVTLCVFFVWTVSGEQQLAAHVTLRPMSSCCETPELADQRPLSDCASLPRRTPQPDIVQCLFEKSHWLSDDKLELNKDAFKKYLGSWASKNPTWSKATDLIKSECIDSEPRKQPDANKAFGVFMCATMAFIRKCPADAWTCR